MADMQDDKSKDPVQAKALEVIIRDGDDVARAIKKFMKKVRNDGLLRELFLRRSYEKPSQKKRRKSMRSKKNNNCDKDSVK